MKYKVKKVNWYGFNHEAVINKFEGDLVFINEFSVSGTTDYVPVAVYKAKHPNLKKGHKKYMLLYRDGDKTFVSGMSAKRMAKERYQQAVLCLECRTVLYSINRHHYHTCDCTNEAMVDGGKDYLRCGAKDLTAIEVVELDLLTNKIVEKKHGR